MANIKDRVSRFCGRNETLTIWHVVLLRRQPTLPIRRRRDCDRLTRSSTSGSAKWPISRENWKSPRRIRAEQQPKFTNLELNWKKHMIQLRQSGVKTRISRVGPITIHLQCSIAEGLHSLHKTLNKRKYKWARSSGQTYTQIQTPQKLKRNKSLLPLYEDLVTYYGQAYYDICGGQCNLSMVDQSNNTPITEKEAILAYQLNNRCLINWHSGINAAIQCCNLWIINRLSVCQYPSLFTEL